MVLKHWEIEYLHSREQFFRNRGIQDISWKSWEETYLRLWRKYNYDYIERLQIILSKEYEYTYFPNRTLQSYTLYSCDSFISFITSFKNCCSTLNIYELSQFYDFGIIPMKKIVTPSIEKEFIIFNKPMFFFKCNQCNIIQNERYQGYHVMTSSNINIEYRHYFPRIIEVLISLHVTCKYCLLTTKKKIHKELNKFIENKYKIQILLLLNKLETKLQTFYYFEPMLIRNIQSFVLSKYISNPLRMKKRAYIICQDVLEEENKIEV